MQRKILVFLIKWISKIHVNTGVALKDLRRHLYFFDFEEREDDVYIVTFLKSGTTWMQVIVHNLLTDGNMDFNHIYDVSPWPGNQAHRGLSADGINQLPSPRILKSHDRYNDFDKQLKNKIIYVYRDGKDVAVSLYHHNKNYLDPALTFDKNFETYFSDLKSDMNYFRHMNEWFTNKHRFNIHYVSYESLTSDFDNTVKKIADFLGVVLTPEILERTRKHASFEYMKAHESKFGEMAPEPLTKLVFNEFIRKGKTGEGEKYISDEQLQQYNRHYKMLIAPFSPEKK